MANDAVCLYFKFDDFHIDYLFVPVKFLNSIL